MNEPKDTRTAEQIAEDKRRQQVSDEQTKEAKSNSPTSAPQPGVAGVKKPIR